MSPEVERALRQALACREDRRRAEQALEVLREKETDAMEQLKKAVESRDRSRS